RQHIQQADRTSKSLAGRASLTGPSPTKQAPSSNWWCTAAATRRATRVLPVPPGPVRVNSWHCGALLLPPVLPLCPGELLHPPLTDHLTHVHVAARVDAHAVGRIAELAGRGALFSPSAQQLTVEVEDAYPLPRLGDVDGIVRVNEQVH